ncbi:MAG: ROK family transcriptional regulator [Acidobacteriota bacterium]
MLLSVSRSSSQKRQPNLAHLQSAGPESLRSLNARLLMNLINAHASLSRADLSRLSGLTRATVSSIVRDLLREKYLLEGELTKPSQLGGKPATPLVFNRRRFGIAALDIRADETVLALSDFAMAIVDQRRFPTRSEAQPFFRQLGREVRKLRQKHPEFQEIAGLGVSLPGLVNHRDGLFLSSVVLPWRDAPVASWLESAARLPVVVDSAARCASLAEIWHGKSRYANVRSLLYISVSYGLACGLVIDGSLYRGHNDSAGQFGHISLDLNGPPCRCGLRGCWDLYASDRATVERYQKLSGSSGRRAPTMRRLVELIEAGDTAAMQAARETAHYLGIGIVGLINGLDPDIVVVGGHITKVWDLIEPILEEAKARNQLNRRARATEIRRSTFEVRPTLKGALTLILNELLSLPNPL